MTARVPAVNPVQVWINGRFLDRPVTGVERVARELLTALSQHYLDAEGGWTGGERRWEFCLLAPKQGGAGSPWPNIPLVRDGSSRGHWWEQTYLPRRTQGSLLLNLCNTGPLWKRDQILFLHDAQPFAIPQNFPWWFGAWYRFLYRTAGRSAARVLVNSQFTRRELARFVGIDMRRMDTCTLGVDHLERLDADDKLLDRFGLPEQPFVLAVSSENPNKNFPMILRALASMGNEAPQLVVVGKRSQRHFRSVQLDETRVRHLGYVSDPELLALYRRALCLVYPSVYEGFGLPPAEAMAQGCPVIASSTGALPEVCGDAAIYVNPHNPLELAHALSVFQKQPAQQVELSVAGAERVKRFRWSQGARAILDALRFGESALGGN